MAAGFLSNTDSKRSVETGLKQWLQRDDDPGDFYLLVGQPRLCQDRPELLNRFVIASDYLFQCQNHKEKPVRDRAMVFQRQVAEARRIVADDQRWRQYDQLVTARLRQLYRHQANFAGETPGTDDLRRWLALVQQVDPGRIEDLIQAFAREEDPATSSLPETLSATEREIETLSLTLDDDAEDLEVEDEFPGPAPVKGKTPPPVPARSAKTPPPVPKLPPKIPPITKVPPPRGGPRTVPQTNGAKRPAPPKAVPSSPSGSAQSPVGWVVLAAFLGALVLGVLGLLIAWASGAFDQSRPRAARRSERTVPRGDLLAYNCLGSATQSAYSFWPDDYWTKSGRKDGQPT